MNREQWLTQAMQELSPSLSLAGLSLPAGVRVSCGFPSRSALSARSRVVGQCWRPEACGDGIPQVFISPVLCDPVDVLGTLLHEMIHAAGLHHHKASFLRAALTLGLIGPAKTTTVGEFLKASLNILSEKLGEYPHAAITASARVAVQSTRLLKVQCPDCGYLARITAKWIEGSGCPVCPCGQKMRQDV